MELCPRCSLEIPNKIARCPYCGIRVGRVWRAFSGLLVALVILGVVGALGVAWWTGNEVPRLRGVLLAVSSLALVVGIIGRSREAAQNIPIALLLGAFAVFAWLSQHPESPWLARAQDWPIVGPAATWFRQAYLGPEGGEEIAEADDEPIEIIYLTPRRERAPPPERRTRGPAPGTRRIDKPPEQPTGTPPVMPPAVMSSTAEPRETVTTAQVIPPKPVVPLFDPARSAQQSAETFAEVIEVRVVNLEVVVTDRRGVRVSGLAPKDFILMVDGQEVPIEYFTEVLDGSAVARPDNAGAPTPQAAAPEGAVGTSFLVFIDEYLSLPHHRNRILDHLIDDLPVLGREDRMAVVAFNGKELEMLSNWSQSVAELERVLKAAKERRTYGIRREARLRRSALPSGLTRRLENEHLVRQVEDELRRVTLAATTILRSFAKPPGRKAMLLLAGGWPYNP